MKVKLVALSLFLSLSGIQASIASDHFNMAERTYGDESYAHVSQLSRDTHMPIMVIFTASDCGYCKRLKEEVVMPMLERGAFRGKALVREFDIDLGGKVVDFDGERTRRRIFVTRYEVFATPTVVFLDDQGDELTPPLVGFDQADTYLTYLEHTLGSANTALAALKGLLAGARATLN